VKSPVDRESTIQLGSHRLPSCFRVVRAVSNARLGLESSLVMQHPECQSPEAPAAVPVEEG
jgi:hypothetical protein